VTESSDGLQRLAGVNKICRLLLGSAEKC